MQRMLCLVFVLCVLCMLCVLCVLCAMWSACWRRGCYATLRVCVWLYDAW